MVPWTSWVHNPNGISIGSAVFEQITAECRYTLQRAAPSPLKLPLPMGDLDRPPSNTWFLGPIQAHNQNGILIGSAIFADDCRCLYTLQWDAHFSHQNCPCPWGNLDCHLIHGSLGLRPTQVLNPNGILIGSAVLQGSLVWQTNHATWSVKIDPIYLCSTATWPNKNTETKDYKNTNTKAL